MQYIYTFSVDEAKCSDALNLGPTIAKSGIPINICFIDDTTSILAWGTATDIDTGVF